MKGRLSLMCLLALLAILGRAAAENWNGWRGPRGDGTSHEQELPIEWDGRSGHNVRWKVAVPGEGHSSPIVWDDRVFLTSCLNDSQERLLLCFDRHTGRQLWRQTVLRSKLETKHARNSRASSTPATDGELVVVAFLQVDGRTIPAPNVSTPRPITPGEIVVAAYDLQGNQKWQTEVGSFVSAHGFCSNPVIYQDLVIINGDHDGDAYIVALDRHTGQERWRDQRENKTRSYVTPIIRDIAGRTQMVLSGSLSVVSYDPLSGRRHWKLDGPTEQFVASMVFDGKLLFLTAGYPEYHILAIRPDGSGQLGPQHIVWRTRRGAAYVPSPIVVGPYLLVVSDGGVASCFESATGQRHWMKRIGKRYSASPVAADGRVYFLADDGTTTVIRADRDFDKLAENRLGEPCSSSPAVSGGLLLIRGHQHLFAIGRIR